MLHPADGTFEVTAAGIPLGTGHLNPHAGVPAALSVAASGPASATPPAVDDVMVLPMPCAEPAHHPAVPPSHRDHSSGGPHHA
jgi:hypothetical protein